VGNDGTLSWHRGNPKDVNVGGGQSAAVRCKMGTMCEGLTPDRAVYFAYGKRYVAHL
jgi:hypothetical protein